MSRETSIKALIKKCDDSLSELSKDYQSSLDQKHLSEELKVDIKNILENLRSCLDYLAKDIHDKYTTKKQDRLYFPIRYTKIEFDKAISNDFCDLNKICPDVYQCMEKIQPYNDNWLGQFNSLNNNNKHYDLVEQTRTESRQVTVESRTEKGSVSWGPGVRFGSGVSVMGVPINPATQMPVPNNIVNVIVAIWVDFTFKDNGKSIIPFIMKSIDNIKGICTQVRNFL